MSSTVDRSRLPTPRAPHPFRFPSVFRQALPNGLDVRAIEHRAVPVVSIVALVRGGSSADPEGRAGLAAFAADLLDDGAGDLDGVGLADAFARIGAEADIEVWPDALVVSVTTLARHAARAMALLADVLRRPRFAADDVERVRQLRLDRLRQMRAQAAATADRVTTHALYGRHPYGHLGIGRAESVRAVTAEEVRDFHAAHATPRATTLVVVGDLEIAAAVDLVAQAFSDWTGGPAATVDVSSGVPSDNGAKVVVVPRAGAAQSEIRVGQVGVSRSTGDYHALLLWNAVLGGQFVSRLNLLLRQEKGYTYGVRSGFDFRRGRGPFSVQASVQGSATAESVQDVLREIDAMCGARPATEGELGRAKSSISLGYPRGFETPAQVARGAAQLALHALPDDHFERFVPTLDGVTLDEVTAAARRHVRPAAFTTVVVGDPEAVTRQFGAIGVAVDAVDTDD